MLTPVDFALWLATMTPLADLFPDTFTVSPDGRWGASAGGIPVGFDRYEPPDATGALLVIAVIGGGPTQLERVVDTPTVNVLIRGDQSDYAGGQTLANRVDDAVMGAPLPALVGATRGISLDQLSGPPQYLDVDTARRAHWTVSYTLRTARTVF